jgi:hypothetical protein
MYVSGINKLVTTLPEQRNNSFFHIGSAEMSAVSLCFPSLLGRVPGMVLGTYSRGVSRVPKRYFECTSSIIYSQFSLVFVRFNKPAFGEYSCCTVGPRLRATLICRYADTQVRLF